MNRLEKIMLDGGVAVIPTDTLYGLVASALKSDAVLRVDELKKRSRNKPYIILISSIEDVALFGIALDDFSEDFLKKVWPGKVSVVLPITKPESVKQFEYLHRGQSALAFRIPNKKNLLELLAKTGPLVAPSANPEGFIPPETIEDAKKYFGDNVELYVDEGRLEGEPSTLVSIDNKVIRILREGAVKI